MFISALIYMGPLTTSVTLNTSQADLQSFA